MAVTTVINKRKTKIWIGYKYNVCQCKQNQKKRDKITASNKTITVYSNYWAHPVTVNAWKNLLSATKQITNTRNVS